MSRAPRPTGAKRRITLTIVVSLFVTSTALAAVVNYSYDGVGRLATALYDGNKCITYSYDANGNRTAQSAGGGNETAAVWGTGVLGCFKWSPP